MKVICVPIDYIPKKLDERMRYFSTYSNPKRNDVGYFGLSLKQDVERAGLSPSKEAWDFNTIAISVVAADGLVPRVGSADGWTREIDLTVHLHDPSPWNLIKNKLQEVLKVLTGDFWNLTFEDGGVTAPQAKNQKQIDCDCISLLSGGVDSLVGAIDIVHAGYKPIFVSQTVRGDAETQRRYAQSIRPEIEHIQWSHKIHRPTNQKFQKEKEGSTRGRSITFFSFAALVASSLRIENNSSIDICVPENGFISLNIPLNPGRLGSLSTKTTHPVYLKGIQDIWNELGMDIQLTTPYEFKTKGELLSECKNNSLLNQLIEISTSCGRYARHGSTHCGRCVPCLIRRAAFLTAGMFDNTKKGYVFENLRTSRGKSGADDIGAMAMACHQIREYGVQRIIAGNLFFSEGRKRKDYEGVITRGFKEIENLLERHGVL